MAESVLAKMWTTLVSDQLKDESSGSVNKFIYIMRGRLLGYLTTLEADTAADNAYYAPGHRIVRDVNEIYHKTLNYAFKKSRDPIPAEYITVADEIDFPRIDRPNEIQSLIVADAMYKAEISQVKDIEAFLDAQYIIALYGTPGMTQAALDYFTKMTEMWKNILTGRQIITPDKDVQELGAIVERLQKGL